MSDASWTDWTTTEPTGQKFMTGEQARAFLSAHVNRCHVGSDGRPDIVILDKPCKLRPIGGIDRYWVENLRLKDLIEWPPAFGPLYAPAEIDAKMYALLVDGAEAAPPVGLRILGVYQAAKRSADIPCSPDLLVACAVATIESLRGRRVMEIAEEELAGPR